MIYFIIHTILFLVLSVNGYWYPVNNISEQFNLNHFQEKTYIPIPNSKVKHITLDFFNSNPFVVNFSSSFVPSILPSIDKTTNNEKADTKVLFNNIISNTNFVNITRPKRKIRRRFCGQKNKKSNFASSSRGRFLEVFEVVQFDHTSCTSSTGLEGICLPEIDCHHQGGTVMGTCADGYGTCCIVIFNCDGRSNARAGWFTNPGFPSPSSERLSCIFTMDKNSEDVKQIRMDFQSFELLPPIYGNCEQDQFVVIAQNTNNIIPILCGINTGQHVYIEVSNVDGPLIFSMQTITEENRVYSIKISQLMAWDKMAAPTGCLQFYKETQGHLESFNYEDRSEIGIPRSPSYMNNLNYAMCIERSPNSCSVTYTNVGDMQIVNYDTEGLPVIPPQQAGVEILNCPSDYLLMAAVRLCGERLNDGSVLQDFSLDAPVTDDSAGPIVIWFRSDGVYTGRGFKLQYQQNPCTK